MTNPTLSYIRDHIKRPDNVGNSVPKSTVTCINKLAQTQLENGAAAPHCGCTGCKRQHHAHQHIPYPILLRPKPGQDCGILQQQRAHASTERETASTPDSEGTMHTVWAETHAHTHTETYRQGCFCSNASPCGKSAPRHAWQERGTSRLQAAGQEITPTSAKHRKSEAALVLLHVLQVLVQVLHV